MNRASVLCMPSLTMPSGETEGFGMVCAEAQAVGKPVVAFNSGAIPEIIRHGQTGFMAADRDWQTLAQYLATLLKNAELRERFGRAGREVIVREFDLEHCTRRLERIYGMVSGTEKVL
jgi:glycosyltransferase involved in cell wall biosynthesis